jgi:hypothetical protein
VRYELIPSKNQIAFRLTKFNQNSLFMRGIRMKIIHVGCIMRVIKGDMELLFLYREK